MAVNTGAMECSKFIRTIGEERESEHCLNTLWLIGHFSENGLNPVSYSLAMCTTLQLCTECCVCVPEKSSTMQWFVLWTGPGGVVVGNVGVTTMSYMILYMVVGGVSGQVGVGRDGVG